MAANASVAAVRQGAEFAYRGRIGDDAPGEQVVACLAAKGVCANAVRRIAGARSPRNAALVDDVGERLICAYNVLALDDGPSRLPLASLAICDAVLADVRRPRGAALIFEPARVARVCPPCSMPTSLRSPRCAASPRDATMRCSRNRVSPRRTAPRTRARPAPHAAAGSRSSRRDARCRWVSLARRRGRAARAGTARCHRRHPCRQLPSAPHRREARSPRRCAKGSRSPKRAWRPDRALSPPARAAASNPVARAADRALRAHAATNRARSS
jgi:hypothetical protein